MVNPTKNDGDVLSANDWNNAVWDTANIADSSINFDKFSEIQYSEKINSSSVYNKSAIAVNDATNVLGIGVNKIAVTTTYNGVFGQGNEQDENPTSYANVGSTGAYIKYDLALQQNFAVFVRWNASSVNAYLETSNDGNTWTNVGTLSGNSGSFYTGLNARYIRVISAGSGNFDLYDFFVFQSAQTSISTEKMYYSSQNVYGFATTSIDWLVVKKYTKVKL